MLSLVLVLWGIGTPSFWRDESVSVMAATMSFDELWRLLDDIDAVHALYYLMLRPFAAFGGEFAVRLPSALAVAGATFGVAAIGRRLATPQVGLLAGLVYALLPMISRYGQEARSYALVSAVAVAATWVLLGERRSRYAWYGLLVALLGWFHLYALLLLPAHAAVVVRRRGETVPWLASLAGAGVLLAPLAVIASGQREEQLFWLKVPGLPELGQLGVDIAGGDAAWTSPLLPALFLATLIALVLLGIWHGTRLRRRGVLTAGGRRQDAEAGGHREDLTDHREDLTGHREGLTAGGRREGPVAGEGPGRPSLAGVAVPWAVLPVVLSLLISQIHPVYSPRYVLFAVPGLALLAGVGLAALRRTPATWAALTALAVLAASAHLAVRGPANRPDDLRTLAAELSAQERPGDAVLYVPERFRLFVVVYGEPYRRLSALGPGSDRVWLVSRRIRGPEWEENPRLKELKRDFRKAGQTRISGAVRITLYTRRIPSDA
ncbi:glycosyltransferase family 39 protein [Streptosporangium roseum]|uniref:glycosyltransferase family 39 protein n=1 Tax=Streptosporangium roseum TaxID=2001 RepID=UPI0001A3EAFB|nr:glycosyltransferase family 39 protein [Streptosporangium roseum]